MIKKYKKICLFTASGQENLGDELITLCEIREFREKNKDIHITLFSHNPDNTRRFLKSQECDMQALDIAQYFPHFLWKTPIRNIFLLIKTIQKIKSSEAVCVGGGGLFYSSREEGKSPIKLWSLRVAIAKIFSKPVHYIAIGVTTRRDEIRAFSKVLFKNTDISVRDRESQQVINQLGYEAQVRTDPVFGLQVSQKTKHRKGKKIGVSLRAGYVSDEIVTKTVRGLLREGYAVTLLPHSLHPSDEKSHDGYYLQKFLFPGVSITQTIEQTLRAYTDIDIVIGMRLHSMILATVYDIPLIALSYSTKTRTIFENKCDFFLSTQTVTAEDIISCVQKIQSK